MVIANFLKVKKCISASIAGKRCISGGVYEASGIQPVCQGYFMKNASITGKRCVSSDVSEASGVQQ